MNALRRGPLVPLLAAVLLLAVVLGAVLGLWQLALPATAALIVLGLLWTHARSLDVASAVQKVRGELREAGDRESTVTERVDALSKAVADLPARLDALHSDIIESRTEVTAELRTFDDRVAGNASIVQALETTRAELGQQRSRVTEQRYEIDQQRLQSVEQRQVLDELLASVQEASTQTNKTKQQLNRSVRRQVEMYGMLELLEGKFIARLDQFVDEAQRELRKNRLQVAALSQQIDGRVGEPSPSGIAEFVVDEKFNVSRYLYYMSHQIPKEVEALQQLQRTLDPIGFTPLLGGWALSPSGALDIITVIERDRPEVVVECGSGSSTVWLALALRANGAGHLYSLEHDPTFAESVRGRVAEQGLTDFVTVLDAPIVDHETVDGTREWYAVDGLADVQSIDVLVVDGPPQALGNLRGGALALLRERLGDGSHLFFDDVHRAEERDAVEAYRKEFPQLRTELSPTPVQAHLTWQIADGR